MQADVAALYPLPELAAVSERQKAYAVRVRNRFVWDHEQDIRNYLRFEELRQDPAWRESMEKELAAKGQTLREYLDRADSSERWTRCTACLRETDAGKLLDALTGK